MGLFLLQMLSKCHREEGSQVSPPKELSKESVYGRVPSQRSGSYSHHAPLMLLKGKWVSSKSYIYGAGCWQWESRFWYRKIVISWAINKTIESLMFYCRHFDTVGENIFCKIRKSPPCFYRQPLAQYFVHTNWAVLFLPIDFQIGIDFPIHIPFTESLPFIHLSYF